MRIRSFVVFLVILSSLPIACDPDDDCGGGNGNTQVLKAKELKLTVGSVGRNGNRIEDFSTQTSTDVDFAAIALTVTEFSYQQIAQNTLKHTRFSWGSQLFACDPAVSELINLIDSIQITSSDTVTTSNQIYPNGQALNSLFNASYYGEIQTVENMITSLDRSFFTSGNKLLFLLNTPVDPVIDHELTFTITMQDGEVFILKTNEFEIK